MEFSRFLVERVLERDWNELILVLSRLQKGIKREY